MWVFATDYPLAAKLTGNRVKIPDSAATVWEQRMRIAEGYSYEGSNKKCVPKPDTCPCISANSSRQGIGTGQKKSL